MTEKQKPALLLLPNLLGEHKHHEIFLPSSVDRAVETIDGLIAESERAGRRFLSRFQTKKPATEIPIALLNEHTKEEDFDFILKPIMDGERWGLISDAGLPCIADPGSKLVARARKTGIVIQTFVGPSAVIMALMLSGFSGQSFMFNGYLDKEPNKREQKIRLLEKKSKQEGSTQIFIEAPYRNQHTLESLIKCLNDETSLCVCWDLTMPTQGLVSQKVGVWKKSPLPNLDKKPAIFLISA